MSSGPFATLRLGAAAADDAERVRDATSAAYWKSTQEVARAHQGMPVSYPDATTVGGSTVQDCAVLWPTNTAAWLFSQEHLCTNV